LLQECKLLRGVQSGQSKVTGGYKLPAKRNNRLTRVNHTRGFKNIALILKLIYVLYFTGIIHTVGPQVEDDKTLSSCYKSALEFCVENQIRTVVSISTFVTFMDDLNRPCIFTGFPMHINWLVW